MSCPEPMQPKIAVIVPKHCRFMRGRDTSTRRFSPSFRHTICSRCRHNQVFREARNYLVGLIESSREANNSETLPHLQTRKSKWVDTSRNGNEDLNFPRSIINKDFVSVGTIIPYWTRY